ncbi:MAG: pitrilysin family protein, partial [Verrucomicrobiales bacterium]|nr:pitrilysin family protein [Verrucomicrobiales bacterium]
FNAVFTGGLLAETEETSGVTQLLSSTVVKGTAGRSGEEIADLVEGVGGGIGASAGNNSFSVSLELMRPDVGLGAGVFGDVLSAAAFPDAEVEREREVQVAALKREDEHLMTVAMKEARRRLFPGHAYAMTRSGRRESVAGLSGQAVRSFADGLMTAGNGVIGVFGAVGADEIEARLEEAMVGMRAGERQYVEVGAPEQAGESGEFDVSRDKEQAVLLVGFRAGGVRSRDRVILNLIDEACSDMASRLFVRIREELGLAYYVGATQFVGLAGGAFQFYLGTSPEQLDRAQGELVDEIGRLAGGGLESGELARAKKTYLGKYLLELQSNASLAQTCGLDELFGFGYGHHAKLPEEIEAVTAADVKRVAGEVFGNQQATVVRVKR